MGKKKAPNFSSENQPEGRGRPKSKLPGLVKELKLTKSDVHNLHRKILEMPLKEVEALAKNPDTPMIEVVIAEGLIGDRRRNNTYSLEKMLDRLYGKATQPIDAKVSQEVYEIIPAEKPESE